MSSQSFEAKCNVFLHPNVNRWDNDNLAVSCAKKCQNLQKERIISNSRSTNMLNSFFWQILFHFYNILFNLLFLCPHFSHFPHSRLHQLNSHPVSDKNQCLMNTLIEHQHLPLWMFVTSMSRLGSQFMIIIPLKDAKRRKKSLHNSSSLIQQHLT